MSRAIGKFVIPVFLVAVFPLVAAAGGSASPSPPEFLDFDELVALPEIDDPPAPLQRKLDHLLNTPYLGGHAAQPHRPLDEGLGASAADRLLEYRTGL